jgi:hypothetical protein
MRDDDVGEELASLDSNGAETDGVGGALDGHVVFASGVPFLVAFSVADNVGDADDLILCALGEVRGCHDVAPVNTCQVGWFSTDKLCRSYMQKLWITDKHGIYLQFDLKC